MAFCGECGKPLQTGAKFCTHCGKPATFPAAAAVQSHSAMVIPDEVRKAIAKTIFVLPQKLLVTFANFLDTHSLQALELVTAAEANAIQTRAQKNLIKHQSKVGFVCLLGNWNEVPPFIVDNPYDDMACQTDAPYGCFNPSEATFDLIPEIPVGRIPVLDLKVIERVLLEPLTTRKHGQEVFFAVSAQKWLPVTQAILTEFDQFAESETQSREVLFSSPDFDVDELKNKFQFKPVEKGSWILFNVHGGPDSPAWVGESDGFFGSYPKIFEAGTISEYANSIFVTEACYGGALGYETESIVEHFFMNGGKSFVGCSVVAYGNPGLSDEPMFAADTIALTYMQAVRNGEPLGKALTTAKLETLVQGHPGYKEILEKTVRSFNYFGAPWHIYQGKKPSAARPAPPTGSTLESIRQRMRGNSSEPDRLLDRSRASYLSRLPQDQQRFMCEQRETLTRLNGFVDHDAILQQFENNGFDEDQLLLQFFESGDEEGYLIIGNKNSVDMPVKKEMIVLTDVNGRMIQVVTSK